MSAHQRQQLSIKSVLSRRYSDVSHFQESVPSIWAPECVSKQTGVADSQGRGKQEKYKRKLKLLFTKYSSASSVTELTSGYL